MQSQPLRTARRLRRPSWTDLRLLVGLSLVLVSVAAGGRLFASLDHTVGVYAAAQAWQPGEELRATDVTVVDVRLGESEGRYLEASEPWEEGTFALRQLEAGELVPQAAVGAEEQATGKAVTVPVDPTVAQGVTVGARVDVWVSRPADSGAAATLSDPELVLERAVVTSVPSASGALGVGVGQQAIQISVPADHVPTVIAAVDQEARVTLVPAPGAGD